MRPEESYIPAGRPHHEGSRGDGFHARAVTLRAPLGVRPRVGARPPALGARVGHRHRKLLVNPSGRLDEALSKHAAFVFL